MNDVIALSANERREVFTETGVRLGMAPFHVEKDFWVCWTLAALFTNNQIGPHLVFRGGTSLSKGWGLIQRFSEDIDLAMNRSWVEKDLEAEASFSNASKSQQERRLRSLRKKCREVIRELIVPRLEERLARITEDASARVEVEAIEKARDPFVVYFRYPESGLTPPSEYFQARVKIELSGRADGVPVSIRNVEPYVADVFPSLVPPGRQYEIPCVQPIRTFWEKVALLHEQNTRKERVAPASRQSRHFYDVHKLWTAGRLSESARLDEQLFRTVMQHRSQFFAYNWVNHLSLNPEDLNICPPDAELSLWRNDYREMESMFIESAPKFEQVVATLRAIEAQFKGNGTRTQEG
jgi:hypothetical protein